MIKKMLALMLVVLLSNVAAQGATHAAQTGNRAATIAERTRLCAVRLSTSRRRNERIEVRLRDGAKLKGYVGVAEESHFTIINSSSGLSTSVPYAEVTNLRCGRSVSRELARGGIIFAAVIGSLVAITLISLKER